MRVKLDEMTNISTVKAIIPPINALINHFKLLNPPELQPSTLLRVKKVLSELILFIQMIPEVPTTVDPLKVEEVRREYQATPSQPFESLNMLSYCAVLDFNDLLMNG